MKYLTSVLTLSLISTWLPAMCHPVSEQTLFLPPLINLPAVENEWPRMHTDLPRINLPAPQEAVIMALVKTHRHPRSWKTLKLIPGKEFRFFYRCVDANGQEYTKQLPVKYAPGVAFKVPDDRPYGEKHPNAHVVTGVLNIISAPATALLVGLRK